MEQNNLNFWIYKLAEGMIKSMNKNLDEYQDSINSVSDNKSAQQDVITHFNNRLVNLHNKIHEVLNQMTGPAVFKLIDDEDEGDEMVSITSDMMKAKSLEIIASYLLFVQKYEDALEMAEKSNNLETTQEAKYIIAKSKENIKVSTKALAGAKKKQEAEEEKKQDVIATYLEVVKMDPFSDLGKTAAKRLINYYKHTFTHDQVF